MGYCGPQGSQNGSYWLLSIWSGAGSAGYQGNVPDNPHQQGERRNPSALSDETKKFHRDRYRDFFSRPKFTRPRPRLFFETKYFRDRYRDFFSRLNIFETDTETFFRDQNFRDRDRYSQKIEKSLNTEKSRDEMSHSAQGPETLGQTCFLRPF